MKKTTGIDRRNFLKTTFAGACAASVFYVNGNEKDHLVKTGWNAKQVSGIREYRTLGRTGFKVSDIGYGAGMNPDAAVMDQGLKRGINYIDTAEHYANGQSEKRIGEILHRHDRKSIFITTKLNISRGVQTKETIKARYMKCLERMKTNYADCLMIHMTPDVAQVKHEGFHAAYQELKSENKARFLGLSNHGWEQSIYGAMSVRMEDVILAAVDDGRFDVALFVYNFLQKEQGEKIIKACKSKNIGVTLMKTNPVNVYQRRLESMEVSKKRGRRPGESLVKLMDEYKARLQGVEKFKEEHNISTNEQIRDAATIFTLSHPDVHTVCPSMDNFDELNTFIALSGRKLSDSESSSLSSYEENLGKYYCRHACGECESACPNKVPVNTIMRYNHYFEAQGREKHAMKKYAGLTTARAGICENCSGFCEASCRYNVPVKNLLTCAHMNLTLS
ncbi:aldo/keto reductase [candidate division KSB1 bacterium]